MGGLHLFCHVRAALVNFSGLLLLASLSRVLLLRALLLRILLLLGSLHAGVPRAEGSQEPAHQAVDELDEDEREVILHVFDEFICQVVDSPPYLGASLICACAIGRQPEALTAQSGDGVRGRLLFLEIEILLRFRLSGSVLAQHGNQQNDILVLQVIEGLAFRQRAKD